MGNLSEYIDAESLTRLRRAFSAIVQCPVTVSDRPPGRDETHYEMPIRIDRRVIGSVGIERRYLPDGTDRQGTSAGAAQSEWRLRFLDLAATLLGRLCEDRQESRRRAEQLATLYQVTAEFTGTQELQMILDQVARTVLDVLQAKACSIRLLSENRTELLVQAVAGLSQEYLEKGPILVSQSVIDQEVLRTLRPVYIADERADPRVLYPAEARREGIVSALCAPITYKGRVEGVLRVYTAEAHEFDWFEVSLLEAIAAQAGAAIVNARLHQEAMASERMRRALAMAGEVQRRMIPSSPPSIPGYDIAAVYVPTYELSGDFFDFLQLPTGKLGIVVCDVVGKGVRASLLMSSVRSSLRAHAHHFDDLPTVVEHVNADLCEGTQASDFATLVYAELDPPGRRLTYAVAGHPPPILLRDGEARPLEEHGMLLGIDEGASWSDQTIDLQTGDVLLIYTDGLTEAMNFNDEAFGRRRVVEAARAAIDQGRSADGLARHVVWAMRCFAGLQQRLDDLTLLALCVV